MPALALIKGRSGSRRQRIVPRTYNKSRMAELSDGLNTWGFAEHAGNRLGAALLTFAQQAGTRPNGLPEAGRLVRVRLGVQAGSLAQSAPLPRGKIAAILRR